MLAIFGSSIPPQRRFQVSPGESRVSPGLTWPVSPASESRPLKGEGPDSPRGSREHFGSGRTPCRAPDASTPGTLEVTERTPNRVCKLHASTANLGARTDTQWAFNPCVSSQILDGSALLNGHLGPLAPSTLEKDCDEPTTATDRGGDRRSRADVEAAASAQGGAGEPGVLSAAHPRHSSAAGPLARFQRSNGLGPVSRSSTRLRAAWAPSHALRSCATYAYVADRCRGVFFSKGAS